MTQIVLLHTRYSSPAGQFQPGAKISVSDDEAEQLIAGHFAAPCVLTDVERQELAESGLLNNQNTGRDNGLDNEHRTDDGDEENRGDDNPNQTGPVEFGSIELKDVPEFPDNALEPLAAAGVTNIAQLGEWIRTNGNLAALTGIGEKTSTKIRETVDAFAVQQRQAD